MIKDIMLALTAVPLVMISVLGCFEVTKSISICQIGIERTYFCRWVCSL